MPGKKLPLALLSPGDAARVVDVVGEGAFRRRLLDMGFIKGTFVRVIKHAPLRDPIEYCIGGTHVTLRRREAMHVVVEQVPVPSWCVRRPPHPWKRRYRWGFGGGRRWRKSGASG